MKWRGTGNKQVEKQVNVCWLAVMWCEVVGGIAVNVVNRENSRNEAEIVEHFVQY